MSSGQPPAAIAILRISGPAAMDAARALAGPLPPARWAAVRALRDSAGELLDRALVLVFPGPASATGEDLVELHCHGGRAVVAAVEAAVLGFSVRRAVAGEFTRRALLNGRIDLSEAQGLADLLTAETEMERRHAVRAAEGDVYRLVRGWLERLTMLAAEVEASIDLAGEGDVEAGAAALATVIAGGAAVAAEIRQVLAAPPVERWRDGWRIVIAGPPNAGKSTLVNLLGQRDAAIVSPRAGTTRDRIEVSVQRGGVGYVLVDTAGLREVTDDAIEQIGIERAGQALADADLILWLGDERPATERPTLWLHARADLPDRRLMPPARDGAISDADPGSIDRLWSMIERGTAGLVDRSALALHRNEREACVAACELLEMPVEDEVVIAENLRAARKALGMILGTNATADLLDRLFSRFCVGK